jgi:hypothetical protein
MRPDRIAGVYLICKPPPIYREQAKRARRVALVATDREVKRLLNQVAQDYEDIAASRSGTPIFCRGGTLYVAPTARPMRANERHSRRHTGTAAKLVDGIRDLPQLAASWLADKLSGSYRETEADRMREAQRERLRKAFPGL